MKPLKKSFDDIPCHSVTNRGMKKLSKRFIRKVMNRVTRFLRRHGMNIAVDSSGFSTTNSIIWYDIWIRSKNKKKDCIKLHISVEIGTGVIHWFIITPTKRHDSPEFKKLLKHLPELGAVLGDNVFSSRNNYQIVVEKEGVSYLLFKDNAKNYAKGKPV